MLVVVVVVVVEVGGGSGGNNRRKKKRSHNITCDSVVVTCHHNNESHKVADKQQRPTFHKSALCEVTKSPVTSPSAGRVMALTFDTAVFLSPFPNEHTAQQSISILRASSRLQTKG